MSYVKFAPRLYVKTSKNGTQSWVYRYKLAGFPHAKEKGLGSYTGDGRAKLSESAAKKMADRFAGLLSQGIDPWGSRARKQMTFAQIVAEIIEIGTTGKNPWTVDARGVCDTEQAYLRLINIDAKRLARLQFNYAMIEDEVEFALKPVWGTKKGEDMRSRIAKVFEHAKVRKLWTGENPADRERIVVLLGEGRDSRSKAKGGDVVHHAALSYEDVPGIVAQLSGHKGVVSAATRFLILTTARAANVRFCNKADIDREARTWTVSGDGHTGARMKSGVEHVYYLNDQAMAIVDALWDRAGDYLFANDEGQPVNETAFGQKLSRPKSRGGLNLKGQATPHGFRATFGEWVLASYPEKKWIADAMLAHSDGKVASAYFRGDAKEAMQFLSRAWGRHCQGNVTQLFQAA